MPWHGKLNPYHLFVALYMLQQTQVATVLPYLRRFLKAFPTVKALAAAEVDKVLRLWEGLGYYSRARNLHRAAQIIVTENRGRIPRTEAELRALPGVGVYSAAAMMSIGFGEPVAAVDGNVLRILSRVFWLPGGGREGKEKQRAEKLAQAAVPTDHPGDYNQALMDLGAIVCTPRNPSCEACPLQDLCRAYARGQADAIPQRRRAPMQAVRVVAALVRKGDKLLLAQRPHKGTWGGLWELPNVRLEEKQVYERLPVASGQVEEAVLEQYLQQAFGLQVRVGAQCTRLDYGITTSRIALSVRECEVVAGRLRCREHLCGRWVKPEELGQYALPAPHRKVLSAVVALGGAAL